MCSVPSTSVISYPQSCPFSSVIGTRDRTFEGVLGGVGDCVFSGVDDPSPHPPEGSDEEGSPQPIGLFAFFMESHSSSNMVFSHSGVDNVVSNEFVFREARARCSIFSG